MTAHKPGLCLVALVLIGAGAHHENGWVGVAVVAATFLVTVAIVETYLRR